MVLSGPVPTPSASHGNMAPGTRGMRWRHWRGGLAACGLVAVSARLAAAGSCGSDDKNTHRRNNNNDDNCWYELWYFWFIIVLVFITIVVLVIFYCKQQVKRSSGLRGRRCTPVLTMPRQPPLYEAPGCQPPPYHIAITTTQPAAAEQGGPAGPPYAGQGAGDSAHSGHRDVSAGQQAMDLPGCVGQTHDRRMSDNISWASTLSVGELSLPPPYSPPHTAYRQQRNRELGLEDDVAL